jgi:hypothetical protein
MLSVVKYIFSINDSEEYNKGYVSGYNDGWVDAKNGVQDPKC